MISGTRFLCAAWAIAFLIGSTVPASTTRRADEARSAAAIEQLRSDIKVKSAAEIEASEIAVTPLTRGDRNLMFDAEIAIDLSK
ncbi:MAG: hypothetical protein JSS49_22135 [Planctomycetes bacterium]|nr:hypothetical protein [Planctomycetota bacterium]